MNCVFCNYDPSLIIAENELCFAVRDKHPVAHGHILVLSKRHVGTFFELDSQEVIALHELSKQVKTILEAEQQCLGYNLAMNCGPAAGQSIPHFHLHLIPRSADDTKPIFQRLRESIF